MSMHLKSRRAAVLLAIATVVAYGGGSAIKPTNSEAQQYIYVTYCDFLVAPYSACGDVLTGRYAQNGAFYNGSGTVSVCQRGYYGSTTISRTCANNYVFGGSSDYGYYYNNNLAVRLTVGNNSSYRHTIEGRGYVPTSGRLAADAAARSPETTDAPPTTEMQRRFAILAGSTSAEPRPARRTASDEFAVSANAAGQMCISSNRFGLSGCNSVENTIAGANQGIAICSSQLKQGTVAIYGIVPDGVQAVDLEGGSRGTQTATVTNNVYALELPASAAEGITSVVTQGARSSTRASAAVPPELACS